MNTPDNDKPEMHFGPWMPLDPNRTSSILCFDPEEYVVEDFDVAFPEFKSTMPDAKNVRRIIIRRRRSSD